MFGGGGGGLNPRKMKQMMEQMGIDIDDVDAEEVVIRTADEELVFTDAEVQLMNAQGQETYQIVGSPETRERGAGGDTGGGDTGEGETGGGDAGGGGGAGGGGDAERGADEESDGGGIPDEDVDLVATRTGASEADAREALEATNGDLAAAVERLE